MPPLARGGRDLVRVRGLIHKKRCWSCHRVLVRHEDLRAGQCEHCRNKERRGHEIQWHAIDEINEFDEIDITVDDVPAQKKLGSLLRRIRRAAPR